MYLPLGWYFPGDGIYFVVMPGIYKGVDKTEEIDMGFCSEDEVHLLMLDLFLL